VNPCPHFNCGNRSPAGIPRLNHCIDIAVLGGDAGFSELFPDMDGKTEIGINGRRISHRPELLSLTDCLHDLLLILKLASEFILYVTWLTKYL
jgi:hypothetical protein